MEPYKEIVNFDECLYFCGKATMKYGADMDRVRSRNSEVSHFAHRIYYDVEISNIRQITEKQFKKWKPAFQITNIKDSRIIGVYQNEKYELETKLILLHEKLVPEHVQTEGDELHGDFDQVDVVFEMTRPQTKIECKSNMPTGNEEYRDGILYREITTGKMLPGEICATKWVAEGEEDGELENPCIAGEPTGEQEWKDSCVRYEYYSGNLNADGDTCETYWGDWICDCEQGKWTGKTKVQDGWEWREYYNADCTTYWDKYQETSKGTGCLPILLGILALIWAALCIWWTIKYGSFIPILFGIGIPLLLMLLGSGINFLGRYSLGISRFFGFLLNIGFVILMLALINGLFHLFSNTGSSYVPKVDKTQDERSVEEIDPFKSEESGYVPENGGQQQKHKRISLKWTDFNGQRYQGSFVLKLANIRESTYHLKALRNQPINSYAPVYQSVFDKDKYFLKDLYHMLDSIRIGNQQNRVRFAHTVVSMVQSIPYVLILENSCDDPANLRNPQLREMLLARTPCDGFAPFGLRTPTEFLSTFNGDCDTRTLLLYTVLKHYQYEVAIINSDYYGHSMLGLALPELSGAYKVQNGTKYYFWETTDKGYLPGQLDRNLGKLGMWNIELN